jgi:DNA (cytosine-5)-methyltransferase 1
VGVVSAYYNEFKPEAAHMLRQLIRDGLIADGEVDERSITEVQADDIKGFTQCHFFAGIGGWSVALRLALWGDDRPVWTGSCPCQPFSTAGKGKGKADERHLWPVWFRLIRESRPPVVYGEQVSAAIRHGWWDDVADDLEGEGYATRAEIRPASSVGKPHKRDRLWFVADAPDARLQERRSEPVREPRPEQEPERHGTMGDAQHDGWDGGQVAGSNGAPIQHDAQGAQLTGQFEGAGQPLDVADAHLNQQERRPSEAGGEGQEIRVWSGVDTADVCVDVANTECTGRQGQGAMGEPKHSATCRDGQTNQSLDDSAGLQWIACPDGKTRPVEPSIRLLAHGVQHRAPILHAFGNAIVPQVAAEFIKAAGV